MLASKREIRIAASVNVFFDKEIAGMQPIAFDPNSFRHRVDVIGCDAAGARIVQTLANLGISGIHVWEAARVTEDNVANLPFGRSDIGELQVLALLAEPVRQISNVTITAHAENVDGSQKLGEVVFMHSGTSAARREIWKKCLLSQTHVKLLVDIRAKGCEYWLYGVNPNAPEHVSLWESIDIEPTPHAPIPDFICEAAVYKMMEGLTQKSDVPLNVSVIRVMR